MALVLTNANSYSAQIIFETMTAWGSTQMVTGYFTAGGNKMAFEPELNKASRKNSQAKMVFVWDIAQGGGNAFNDALQGYAPYSGNVRYTNVVSAKKGEESERISGHACVKEVVMVSGNDGSTKLLQVWRATDMRGFPLRISGDTNSSVLTLSKIQFGPPAEILMSAEGFTKYESPDAMVTELVSRQQNLRRKSDTSFGSPELMDHQSRPGQPY